MRTWNNTLYLDAMPGRAGEGRSQGNFDLWLREMKDNRIKTVVCLAPEEQITSESPEYAEWRRDQENSSNYLNDHNLIDIPVADFRAPRRSDARRFWHIAKEIAERIEGGEKIFVHCGAGIGRTGMFAVAVLMQKGYPYEEAYREIDALGSHPEMLSQQEFLMQGPPEGS